MSPYLGTLPRQREEKWMCGIGARGGFKISGKRYGIGYRV